MNVHRIVRGRTAASLLRQIARVGELNGPFHSLHYIHIKTALFFYLTLISPFIFRSSSLFHWVATRPTSFFIDSRDDLACGQIFISFTFWFSGRDDSLINSQIMRLNVSSPRLDWFGLFFIFFWPLCVSAAEGER